MQVLLLCSCARLLQANELHCDLRIATSEQSGCLNIRHVQLIPHTSHILVLSRSLARCPAVGASRAGRAPDWRRYPLQSQLLQLAQGRSCIP